jgi:hypothetical protein
MRFSELRGRIEGNVTAAIDADYERLRCEMNWNQLTPMRSPLLPAPNGHLHERTDNACRCSAGHTTLMVSFREALADEIK